MQQYRKKFFKIIELKKWGVLPILVGYFGPCISNENTLPSYTYQLTKIFYMILIKK